MEKKRNFWEAFKNFAIVFSFVVNFVLVLVLLVLLTQLMFIKDQIVNPLVNGLDTSFANLGEATIDTIIPIRQQLPVKFDLPVQFTQPVQFDLPVQFNLPLDQETLVTTVAPTAINTTVNLTMGQFGRINAPISLNLPTGTQLKIRLKMSIPVSTTVSVNQTLPISTVVAVDKVIPVEFDQRAQIKLGPSGLNPVVKDLRGVVAPYKALLQQLP